MRWNNLSFLKRDWPFLVLSLGILLFFKDILLFKKYFWQDIFYLAYPSFNFFATSLKEGHFPFWTPYVFSGMPFMAGILDSFYPINWIFPFFVKNGVLSFFALEIHIIFHILLGGFFTYLYAKEIKLSNFGALISALTFMLSGFVITHSVHFSPVNTFIWLPLILLFIHKALTSGKKSYGILGGVFFGISILAGFPQFTLHISYIIGLYILFYAIVIKKAKFEKKSYNYLFICLIVLLIGYCLASIQYIPSYEYSKYTVRAKMGFEQSTVMSLTPLQIITLFVPKFFGSDTGMGTDSVPSWGIESFWETSIYIGILSLLFTFFAFQEKRKKLVWFFGGIAILSLLAAMGKYTPFYKFIYYIIPGFNKFRIPGRFLGLFSFSTAMLAGFGVDALFCDNLTDVRQAKQKILKPLSAFIMLVVLYLILSFFILKNYISAENYLNIVRQNKIFLFFFLSSLAIVFLQIKGFIRPDILKAMAVVILFADLYIFGHNFNASDKNPYEAYACTPLIKFLQDKREIEPFRIGHNILQENGGNIYRVELVDGYNPLMLQRYYDFNISRNRKLTLLNVKYYQASFDKNTGQVNFQENPDYLSRAFLVFDYVLAPNGNEALKILSDTSFDYKHKVVLEEKPDIDLENVKGQDYSSCIEIPRDNTNPNVVSLHLSTDAPAGFLVFSDIYYPDWKAYVNGKRVKIYCADYVLRAICIGKGESNIKLVYDSNAFKIGLIISLITIIFVILSLIYMRVNSAKVKKN